MRYTGQQEPTQQERKKGAEVVFTYETEQGEVRIKACACYESWEQWGATTDQLYKNVERVENWRQNINN